MVKKVTLISCTLVLFLGIPWHINCWRLCSVCSLDFIPIWTCHVCDSVIFQDAKDVARICHIKMGFLIAAPYLWCVWGTIYMRVSSVFIAPLCYGGSTYIFHLVFTVRSMCSGCFIEWNSVKYRVLLHLISRSRSKMSVSCARSMFASDFCGFQLSLVCRYCARICLERLGRAIEDFRGNIWYHGQDANRTWSCISYYGVRCHKLPGLLRYWGCYFRLLFGMKIFRTFKMCWWCLKFQFLECFMLWCAV